MLFGEEAVSAPPSEPVAAEPEPEPEPQPEPEPVTASHPWEEETPTPEPLAPSDRKSTRLNSSHQIISYAVFCLKKKKKKEKPTYNKKIAKHKQRRSNKRIKARSR